MRVLTKAYLNTFLTMVVLGFVEFSIYKYATSVGPDWVLFLFGPLAFLAAVLFWLYKVTGLCCPNCKKLFGVSIGVDGWPSVPKKCKSCDYSDKA